jgi:hypothetical protein
LDYLTIQNLIKYNEGSSFPLHFIWATEDFYKTLGNNPKRSNFLRATYLGDGKEKGDEGTRTYILKTK